MQTNERVAIDEVEIDGSARLLVRPKLAPSEHYEYIYRTASGVRWSRDARALVPYEIKGMSPAWWFSQIVAAVESEYGQLLELKVETKWTNVSESDRLEIEAASKRHAV